MNDNSMTELAALKQFLENIESQPDLTLSHKQVEDYFKKIVSIAHTPDGYESLCWEVGVWLLLLSDDKQNSYFNTYGYAAISAALSNAIADGNLPGGLGWYTSGFLPNDVDGDIMLGMLSHSIIQANLNRSLSTHEFTLKLEQLDPSDEHLGNAVIKFLAHLHRFGMDYSTQLMWAARLVQHLSPENPSQKLTLHLSLKGLVRAKRYINAFYWLQAYFTDKADHDLEDIIFEIMSAIVKITLDMDDRGYKILARMSYDDKILQVIYCSKRTQLLLAFVILWLLAMKGFPVKQDFIDQSVSLLWGNYSNLSRFIGLFSNWALQITTQTNVDGPNVIAFDYLSAPNQRVVYLSEIKSLFDSLPNYRARLVKEVWKECRNEIFLPLVSSLEDADKQKLDRIKNDISNLDPDQLIDNSKTYRQEHHASRIITGKTRQMIATDFQEYINKLATIADLSHQTDIARMFIEQIENDIEWGNLYRECNNLVEEWPSLEDYIDGYFMPIVDACAASS